MSERRFENDSGVVKGSHFAAHDLAGLVTLARDNEQVAWLQHVYTAGNGPTTVADVFRVRTSHEDFTPYRGGIFVARVIIGDDHVVSQVSCYTTHFRALGPIAITTATEGNNEATLGVWPQRRKNVTKRIWGVGVIHEDLRAIAEFGDELSPTQNAAQVTKRVHRCSAVGACRDHQCQSGKCVFRLERTEKWKENPVRLSLECDLDSLAA